MSRIAYSIILQIFCCMTALSNPLKDLSTSLPKTNVITTSTTEKYMDITTESTPTETDKTFTDFQFKPEQNTPLSFDGLNYLLRSSTTDIFRQPLVLPDIPIGASHFDYTTTTSTDKTQLYNFGSLSDNRRKSFFYIPNENSYHSLEKDKNPLNFDYLKNHNHNIFPNKMIPPNQYNNYEPNYYAIKFKKYPKKYSTNVKQINLRKTLCDHGDPTLFPNNNDASVDDDNSGSSTDYKYDNPYLSINNAEPIPVVPFNFEPLPQQQSQQYHALPYTLPHENTNCNDHNPYQIHGINSGGSYGFGYDSGKGTRQYRYEERDNEGFIVGEYGFIDNGNRLVILRYLSDPVRGIQMEHVQEKII